MIKTTTKFLFIDNNFFNINYYSIVGSVGLIIFLIYKQNYFILFFFIFLIIIFSIFILFFFNHLYNNRFRKYIDKPELESIFKDKEFLLFKNKIIHIYYSSFIILFIFLLLKFNYLNYLLDFNIYFFYFLFFILLFYLLLISNIFILFLFKIYKLILNCIIILNNIKFEPLILNFTSYIKKKNNKTYYYQVKSFSSYSKNKDNNYFDVVDLEQTDSTIETNKKNIKKFKKIFGGGYLGYKYVQYIGTGFFDSQIKMAFSISDLDSKLLIYLNEIPEDVIYSILPVIRWQFPDGEYGSLTLTKSIKVTRNTSRELLTRRIEDAFIDALNIYELAGYNIDLYLMGRPWLKKDDFKLDEPGLTDIFETQIEKELSSWLRIKEYEKNKNSSKVNNIKNYLYKDIIMDKYGDPLYDKNNNLIGFKLNEIEHASIISYNNQDNLLCNKISIREFDKKNLSFINGEFISWIDTKTETGFIREFDKKKYYYDKNNNLINVEVKLNCYKFSSYKKDYKLDNKTGSIDFETFGSNSGLGYHQVYAGGWAIKNKTNLFYLKPNETSEALISRVFLNILMDSSLNGYTFYAHNLGRFDSIFILKSLILNKKIELTPIWKDNSILSIKIKLNKIKITLLDSLQMIPGSLENILNSFNCSIKKGYFPYSFVNKNNLNYIGDKPSKEFYNSIQDSDYWTIPKDNWDLKKETLSYLKSDLEGLLEVITSYRDNIYSKYNINIHTYKTLPSLALAVYCSSYLPNNLKPYLNTIKGEPEREIRTAYFGGNVDVFINQIFIGYLYDINSQYPKAMLEDMPIGEPILSLETNLDKIFGFVYGEIVCPDESSLQVPFIQHRNLFNNSVNCPRGKFKRLIFSEEIKYALKYGYTINIEYCYQFKRGVNLFTDYVKDHYEIKKKTNDPIKRTMAKLFLNVLYGRMGMKDISDTLKIVNKKEAEYLDKTKNVLVLSELTDDKFIIKFSGQISEDIRKHYSNDPSNFSKKEINFLNQKELKESGLNKKINAPSAVHIAAAISSYARILINEYKNIPGNPCIMSDTDSAVLTKPLPAHLVGNELGQMKLENVIKEGMFIRKKLYCIEENKNKIIIKSSGIDSSKLNKTSFIRLLKGETVTIERTNFKINWKDLSVNVVNSDVIIHGLTGPIKTIYNTPDVNFKFISYPIKYNIIVHPLYPMKPIIVPYLNSKTLDSFEIIKSSIGYTYFELISLFIFLFSFFIIFGILLYKIY